MIQLKSKPKRQFIRLRRWQCILLLLMLPVAAVLFERWHGRRNLRLLTEHLAAQGEKLDAASLNPPVAPKSLEFSNRLAQALGGMAPGLSHYAGQLSVVVPADGDGFRRGSQEPFPPFYDSRPPTNTWQDMDQLVRQSQPSLAAIRALLKDPPATKSYDWAKSLENGTIPNFINVRVGAQAMQSSVINNLHNGNLAGAEDDLETIMAFSKLYEQDPDLITYMIRVAILGLSIEPSWDALQADGWTEPQLAKLQRACVDTSRVLAQAPRIMEAQRASRINQMLWLRSHSYEAWIARNSDVYRTFGLKLPGSELHPALRYAHQWLLHPLWSFTEADEEEYEYLRCAQSDVDVLRGAVQHQSYHWLQGHMTARHDQYHLPPGPWRFYLVLPYSDTLSSTVNSKPEPKPSYPYPELSHAWSTTMENLTHHEMVITAIAIKRHQLKYGKSPAALAALVPEFLPHLPTDYMDGKPLRFKLNPGGSYTLYSVGSDFKDNGGDGTTRAVESRYYTAWDRKDWVWPHVARRPAQAQTAQVSASTKQGG